VLNQQQMGSEVSRILITGGAGFIGSGVVKQLAARGDDVIAFDIARSPRLDAVLAEHRNIEFVQGEITEWPQVIGLVQKRKPDAIVQWTRSCIALRLSA
jgi:nucleoside-diphosphate-sugar epimerase